MNPIPTTETAPCHVCGQETYTALLPLSSGHIGRVCAEYRARPVWVRWDSRFVRVYNHRFDQIAVHARHEPGRFSTLSAHIPPEKVSSIERGTDWMLRRAELVGPNCEAWARAVLENRGIQGIRVLQGLLGLIGRHSAGAVETACRKALVHGVFHLRDLRQLLRSDHEQQQLAFLERHPLIRDMSAYGALCNFSTPDQGE